MSLRDDLIQSRKLSPALRAQLIGLADDADPDKPLFSALIKGDGSFSIHGADIHSIAGDIHSARNITLNGLKALVDDERVTYVEGGAVLRPAQAAPPKRPFRP